MGLSYVCAREERAREAARGGGASQRVVDPESPRGVGLPRLSPPARGGSRIVESRERHRRGYIAKRMDVGTAGKG